MRETLPRRSRIKREITATKTIVIVNSSSTPNAITDGESLSSSESSEYCASCMYELITEIITPSQSLEGTEKKKCFSSDTQEGKSAFFLSHTAQETKQLLVSYVRKVEFHESEAIGETAKKNQRRKEDEKKFLKSRRRMKIVVKKKRNRAQKKKRPHIEYWRGEKSLTAHLSSILIHFLYAVIAVVESSFRVLWDEAHEKALRLESFRVASPPAN